LRILLNIIRVRRALCLRSWHCGGGLACAATATGSGSGSATGSGAGTATGSASSLAAVSLARRLVLLILLSALSHTPQYVLVMPVVFVTARGREQPSLLHSVMVGLGPVSHARSIFWVV
jgi:hypothetical protein